MPAANLPTTGALTGVFETLAFFKDTSFAQRRFERYGDVFETCLLGQRTVLIRGEQAISDLLSQSGSLQGWWPKSVRELLGRHSLANRNGADHKARRRVVGQLFSASALCRYTPAIESQVQLLSNELLNCASPMPLAPRMRQFAFSVIANIVLGLDDQNRDELFLDFEMWTKALFSLPIAIPGSSFARAMLARERLLSRLKQLFSDDQYFCGGLDLIRGGLDEAGIPLDDDDLAEQLLLLLFAGYETTASSLNCFFRALLLNPSSQKWLMEELEAQPFPYVANTPCPRLDATVLEVMRLTPPVGGFFRKNNVPIVIDGIEIPADRIIQVVLNSAMRSDQSDLCEFRPQRHMDGSFTQKLLPFGGGERVCLGKSLAELEIRLMTSGLLKNVQLQLEPNQDLSLQQIPSPTPRGGLLISCTRE